MPDETEKPRANEESTEWEDKTLGGGCLSLLLSLFLLAVYVPQMSVTGAGPEQMTLAQIAKVANSDYRYIAVEDGKWDCNTIKHIKEFLSSEIGTTEIIFTDEANPSQIVLLVSMSGKVNCRDFETVKLSGLLKRMDKDKKQKLLEEDRLASYTEASDFLEICGYCDHGNTRGLVMIGGCFGVSGPLLLIVSLRLSKRRKEKAAEKEEKEPDKEENSVITWL
jgi:hypothetical protein